MCRLNMSTEKVRVTNFAAIVLTTQNRDVKDYDLVSVCPSKRWSHTMCLSDADTAILFGGETSDQDHCKDSLWKLELGGWRVCMMMYLSVSINHVYLFNKNYVAKL